MKKYNLPPVDPTRKFVAVSLASLLTLSVASGQTPTPEQVRQLQEENAALRRQLAEIQGRVTPAPTAPTPAPAPAAPPPATTPAAPARTGSVATSAAVPATTSTTGSESNVVTLSPFEVSSERDYGYLRTNSATATRIGMEIQLVPLNISVLSEDFLRDTNTRDIQDVLRYTGASAGDTRMGVLQPATGATPSGNMSLRGFPINSRLRNGVLRYNLYNLDNVERVEVIKGPAAVFFGQAFPGGVINYITKRPQFSEIPTTATYSFGGNVNRMGGQRASIDHNQILNRKAAIRFTGSWIHDKGDRRFEQEKGHSFTPSLTLVPFESGVLKFNLETEITQRRRNQDDTSWQYPQQWFSDYANPSASLVAAGNALAPTSVTSATDVAGYRAWINTNVGNWIASIRRSSGDQYIPLWRDLEHGAYITDSAGNRVHDEKFNYYGPGTYADERVNTTQLTTEASPFPWLDLRHVLTYDNARYSENRWTSSPNADGITWNTLGSQLYRDYVLESWDHQADIVLKHDFAGIKNKLLFGGVWRETYSTFTGTSAANLTGTGQFPFFGNLPGAYDVPAEGYVSPIPPALRGNFGNASQVVRNRAGQILTPVQIYTQFDPGIHPYPDTRRIAQVDRGLVDHYKPRKEEWYVNYQGALLDDRLNLFAGYRHEKRLANGGQRVDANPPWYTGFPNMVGTLTPDQYAAYGVNLNYQLSELRDLDGDSYMGGASYSFTRGITGYVSYSETFLPNTGTLGGDYDITAVRSRATALGLNPDTELARLRAAGGETYAENETGTNAEVGIKTSLWDNRLVTTASIFRVERKNRKLDDSQRQLDEPLNYLGPNATGGFSRTIRWYSNDAEQYTEGFEFEAIWTPISNYQALVSGSWIWDAKTDFDPTLTETNLLTPIVYGNRLINVPEYRFNLFNKFTFVNNGWYRGATIGFGARYASKMNVFLDQNANPARGGYTAGDYLVFDGLLSFPWKISDYRLNFSLTVNNLLDEEYSEGGFNLSPPRSWLLTTSIQF